MRAITIAAALCAACTHAPPTRVGPRPLAIVGATVVFPERDTGTTLGDATVVIAGDRITAIRAATGDPITSTWIHFPVLGQVVQIHVLPTGAPHSIQSHPAPG